MTGDTISDWSLELIDMAQMLRKLRMLAWLQWNYIGAGIDSDDSISFNAPLNHMLSALEDHCGPLSSALTFVAVITYTPMNVPREGASSERNSQHPGMQRFKIIRGVVIYTMAFDVWFL